MDLVWSVLPFVAFLACPLMMVLCVAGMRKMGCAAPAPADAAATLAPRPQQVEALQRQLRAIQDELVTLRASEANAPHAAAKADEHQLDNPMPGTAKAGDPSPTRSVPTRDLTAASLA